MDNSNEASSSLSFVSSPHLSNGSSNNQNNEHVANIEIVSLNKLSGSLEKLLLSDVDYDYCDAEIVVEEIPVGIHRCILASRSQFFHELFKKGKDGDVKEGKGKPRYFMKDLVAYGSVGYEAFVVFLHYLYTGKLKAPPTEVTTCVDEACIHDACRPAINYALELMYASANFKMKELVLLFQRFLLNFVDKALVEDVIPILMAAHHCTLDQLLSPCIQRVARSDMDIISLERELPHEVVTEIKSLRVQSLPESSPDAMEVEPVNVNVNDKSVRKILKALDSDDVELLKLLLEESSVTLDDACALHYACAHCDSKVVQEVLTLGLADILLKNPRGYTVLHVAARRKDPSILVALLKKGACASETTLDGQTALSICQRLTRRKDYHEKTVQGKESHKDRLCVDVLEREMRRNSMMFFPAEAKVAIENAEADSTSLYATSSLVKGNIKEVDLNETPSIRTRKLQLRLQSLVKTVENGRRFFPHCSEVLDKFLEDDMPDVFVLEKGTEEEQRKKKARFMELKDEVQKAFHKDMAENNHSGLQSSLSSTSSTTRRESLNHKMRRK
ncbi:hypothetical protein TSUD_252320 [Trifolium subterraneum]|uniref:BTB domain-containing protein n=1 Tax=Trifolium subterraneum TaxID=3900 RepID=A0A2Z6LSC3_TRISU|nr:hypothetical protein TSUD_252320 [Trifolium subterraneum]